MNDFTIDELVFLELAAVKRTRELCNWCDNDEELMQKQQDYLNKIRRKLNAMQEALIGEDEEQEEPPFDRFSY